MHGWNLPKELPYFVRIKVAGWSAIIFKTFSPCVAGFLCTHIVYELKVEQLALW